MTSSVALRAYAKVNLTLEVLGKRPDGYHDLASVFATIDLRDRVRVARARTLDVRISPPLRIAADDELSHRSVVALAETMGRPAHAHVRVDKRVPIAAGLGGGSSDAGATLRGLARVWGANGVDLCAVGARVGSDVPFFASGAAWALVRGRGEQIEPLPALVTAPWIVLVLLAERVDTAAVFAAHRARPSDGSRSSAVAERIRNGSANVQFLRANLTNDLLEAALHIAPSIERTRKIAGERGIALAMSGSGPSLFALADDRAHALRMSRALRRDGLKTRVCALGVVP